jgi:phosphoribosyl 1,2-cyclic phosphodiesterase
LSRPLEIAFLASGSSGNCAAVRCGGTLILLDAGLSVRETGRRLRVAGASLDEVAGVFVTHEHSDHVRSAADLAVKRGIPVWATGGTAEAARLPGPLLADIRVLPRGGEVTVGDLQVQAVSTPHDGVESVCYRFTSGSGRRIGVVTDLGHLSAEVAAALADCEVLGLEANHDVELLRTGPYPMFLKRRILSDVGHLSNAAAAEGLRALVGPRTRALAALHLSRQNNTPVLAQRAFGAALDALGVRIALEVAAPDRPSRWIAADGEDRPDEVTS